MALTEKLAESKTEFHPKSCCASILENLPAILEGGVRLEDTFLKIVKKKEEKNQFFVLSEESAPPGRGLCYRVLCF